MTWLTTMEYMCYKWPRYVPLVVNTSRSFRHSWLITRFVIRLTRQVPLVEQERTAYPSGAPEFTLGFSGVRVIRSVVLGVYFVDRCLSFWSFGHCVVCSSLNYGFWLSLWYLQTLLTKKTYEPRFRLNICNQPILMFIICLAIRMCNVKYTVNFIA
jgi:hypothetical protein